MDWERDVASSFNVMDEPTTPWRWRGEGSNPALGDWLVDVRQALLEGEGVSLADVPDGVRWVAGGGASRRSVLQSAGRLEGSTVAMLNVANRCHALARQVAPLFRVIEPLGSTDLMRAARNIDETSGGDRVEAVYAFAKTCFTGMSAFDNVRNAAVRSGPHRLRTRLEQHEALAAVRDAADLEPVVAALRSFYDHNDTKVCRNELLGALVAAVRHKRAHPHVSLASAAWHVRDRLRRRGRRLPGRGLGRPVLVKGLEFDHGIVLDADKLSRKELYVALTRGCRSLTVLSSSREIRPEG